MSSPRLADSIAAAYAAQKSGIANVTVVARSNYEIVKGRSIIARDRLPLNGSLL